MADRLLRGPGVPRGRQRTKSSPYRKLAKNTIGLNFSSAGLESLSVRMVLLGELTVRDLISSFDALAGRPGPRSNPCRPYRVLPLTRAYSLLVHILKSASTTPGSKDRSIRPPREGCRRGSAFPVHLDANPLGFLVERVDRGSEVETSSVVRTCLSASSFSSTELSVASETADPCSFNSFSVA